MNVTEYRASAARTTADPRLPYLRRIGAGAIVLLAAGAAVLFAAGDHPVLVAAALLLAVPAAVDVSRSLVTFYQVLYAPRAAPLAELSRADAAGAIAATAVVYPVIVHGPDDVDALLATVRATRRAAGPGFAAHVALVDFADSPEPTRDTDAPLRAALDAGLAALAAAHAGPPVGALYRKRRWNGREHMYMGWERKRGKLEEFAGLTAGGAATSFEDSPLATRLRGLRYAFTIDVGNRPHEDSVWRLVATIAHPDNAAVVDPDTKLVTAGFAFIRATDVPASPGTMFEWILQPYHVPEGELPLPQSVFGRDVFYGQGVLDLAAYRTVLSGRIPCDRVLSHDKLESMHGRAGVIADARVEEANVPEYLQFRQREHRWIRGDVQLLPWAFAPGRGGRRKLPPADRALMVGDVLDHLRNPSIAALLALGWFAAPTDQVVWWTLTAFLALAYPVLLMPMFPLVAGARAYLRLKRQPRRRQRRSLLLMVAGRCVEPVRTLLGVESLRVVVWLPLLADRALNATDAVARGLWRSLVSHRHALQWTPSVTAARLDRGLGPRVRGMWRSCALVAAMAAGLGVLDPTRLVAASPLLVAWLLAPVAAYWCGHPAGWISRVRLASR